MSTRVTLHASLAPALRWRPKRRPRPVAALETLSAVPSNDSSSAAVAPTGSARR